MSVSILIGVMFIILMNGIFGSIGFIFLRGGIKEWRSLREAVPGKFIKLIQYPNIFFRIVVGTCLLLGVTLLTLITIYYGVLKILG